ncbi:NADPH-dependent FMN reductase [Arthrobacter sp. GCM10027362]|uniref:NADPH-dependent FMN reductase n=1 Tax=Arthrobacter sp. GCM10027362 TaxID=3273379 RepID=UPI00363B86EA
MSWFKNLFRKSRAAEAAAAPAVSAPAAESAPGPRHAAVDGVPLRIAVVTGSTRPGRVNNQVAEWVLAQLAARTDARFELVDINSFDLPLLDEPYPAAYQNYQNEHTKALAARISEFDGYIFVTNEYNHSAGPALINALSFLNAEFNNKAAGIVSYGSMGGARAAEHLRGALSELQIAHVRNQVMFNLFTDFENFSEFKPTAQNAGTLAPMVDQLVPWTKGFAAVRSELALTSA